jgi:hypothetical protein
LVATPKVTKDNFLSKMYLSSNAESIATENLPKVLLPKNLPKVLPKVLLPKFAESIATEICRKYCYRNLPKVLQSKNLLKVLLLKNCRKYCYRKFAESIATEKFAESIATKNITKLLCLLYSKYRIYTTCCKQVAAGTPNGQGLAQVGQTSTKAQI